MRSFARSRKRRRGSRAAGQRDVASARGSGGGGKGRGAGKARRQGRVVGDTARDAGGEAGVAFRIAAQDAGGWDAGFGACRVCVGGGGRCGGGRGGGGGGVSRRVALSFDLRSSIGAGVVAAGGGDGSRRFLCCEGRGTVTTRATTVTVKAPPWPPVARFKRADPRR